MREAEHKSDKAAYSPLRRREERASFIYVVLLFLMLIGVSALSLYYLVNHFDWIIAGVAPFE